MLKGFKDWLETALPIQTDRIEDAILGIVAGSDPSLDADERGHLLQRTTTEFSADILDRLRNLGIIKNIGNGDASQYQNILQAINHGILIKDLINKVRGVVPGNNEI